jgi:hypothetical protein
MGRPPPRQRPREGSRGCRAKRTPPDCERARKTCRGSGTSRDVAIVDEMTVLAVTHRQSNHGPSLLVPLPRHDLMVAHVAGGVRFARHPRLPSFGRCRGEASRASCWPLFTVLLLLALISCKPSPKRPTLPSTPRPGEPAIRATVVTIRTTVDSPNPANPAVPVKKTLTHTLTFTTGRARSSDEVDRWRLFDLKQERVTFVDAIARTYRTETLRSLRDRHRQLVEVDPGAAPRVSIVATGVRKTFLQGIEATQYLITVGAYRRELWIASHSTIPQELFATMVAAEMPSSPLAGMAREVDDTLLDVRGFPMLDHTELPLDPRTKYVIDRAVVDIRQQDVPASYLNVGVGYKDVTPIEPGGSHPPASSLPRDRSTRVKGWLPSAIARRIP